MNVNDHAISASSKLGYFKALTGLRGFSAIWVFMFHSKSYEQSVPVKFNLLGFEFDFSLLFDVGWLGVYFFFLLSAFFLAIPFIQWIEGKREYPALRGYYKRRVLRVFPAYYLQLIILIILGYFTIYSRVPNLNEFILHLFMMFRLEPWFAEPLEGVWWTLPTEFSFYLILPLVAILFKRFGFIPILALSLILTVSFRYLIYQAVFEGGTGAIISKVERFPGHISLFVLGAVTSYLYQKLPAISQRLSSILFISGVVWIYVSSKWLMQLVVADLYFGGHYSYFIWNSLDAIGIAMIIYSCASKNWLTEKLFANRVIVFVGVISYSFYLWHMPVLKMLKQYVYPNLQENITFIIIVTSLPIIIAISTISYKFVEAPFIRLGIRKKTKAKVSINQVAP